MLRDNVRIKPLCLHGRLNKDQRSVVTKELHKAVAELKGKEGLEKAVKQFMKSSDTNGAVPPEMRSGYR